MQLLLIYTTIIWHWKNMHLYLEMDQWSSYGITAMQEAVMFGWIPTLQKCHLHCTIELKAMHIIAH